MIKAIQNFEQRSPDAAGQVYGLIATIAFFTLQLSAKPFKDRVHFSQIATIRSMVFMTFISCVAKFNKIDQYPTSKHWMVTIRNFLGYQVTIGLFFGVTQIPVSQNIMLLQIAPIFVPLFDFLINKAKYTLKESILFVVAVFGVYLVVAVEDDVNNANYVHGKEKILVLAILFMSITMGYSFSAIGVKFMTGISQVAINSNFGLVGLILGSILQIYFEKYSIALMDALQIVCTVGISGCISQSCFIRAYTLAKPGKIAILNCLNVLYAFFVEVVFYDEYPAFIQLVGAGLLLMSVIWSILLRS